MIGLEAIDMYEECLHHWHPQYKDDGSFSRKLYSERVPYTGPCAFPQDSLVMWYEDYCCHCGARRKAKPTTSWLDWI